MQITGKIIRIFDAQQVSDKFRKREFVVEYSDNPQYPQPLLLQATQDRCEILDKYQPGDVVDVQFNLRGREWTSPQGEVRYFNTLEAWRVTPAEGTTPAAQHPYHQTLSKPTPAPVLDGKQTAAALYSTTPEKQSEEDDDLPF